MDSALLVGMAVAVGMTTSYLLRVAKERAETLLGGATALTEASRLIGTDLQLGRGGLPEGVALALARADRAAA